MSHLPATTGGSRPPDPYRGVYLKLERQKPEIKKALPTGMTEDHLARAAMNTLRKDPKFQRCDELEIVGCVMEAAQLGLEIGGVLGQCALVPYEIERTGKYHCQLQIGYKGYLALARRSGMVRRFSAHEVYENDEFDYQYGSEAFLRHKPARGDRGEKTVFFYAEIETTDGGYDFEVMSHKEVETHRDAFVRNKKGPWKTHFVEMAKKTLLLKLAKRCPVSTNLQRAASLDEYAAAGFDQGLTIEGTAVSATADDEAELTSGRHRMDEARLPPPAGGTMEGTSPEPVSEPEDFGELTGEAEWNAMVRDLELRIKQAKDLAVLHGIRLELDLRRPQLGDPEYKELFAMGKERRRELEGAVEHGQ